MTSYNSKDDSKKKLTVTLIQKEEELKAVSNFYQEANPYTTFTDILKYTKKTWKKSKNLVFKAELDNELIGGISIRIKSGKALVDDIAIKSNLQKTGIGTKIWKFCENQLKSRGIYVIKGQVHYNRAEIIPFCYKNGFRLKKVVQDGFGPKEDYIELIKYI